MRMGLLQALLIVLSAALAPAPHQRSPDIPAWVLADGCGETTPSTDSAVGCPFCVLQAMFVLLPVGVDLATPPLPRVMDLGPGVCSDLIPSLATDYEIPPLRGPPARPLVT